MVELKAKIRKLKGKKVRRLREKGILPAVVYGHNIPSKMIKVSYNDFQKVLEKTGESTLIDLKIDQEKPVSVLIQDVQLDPVKDKIIHVDFYQVKKGEKIETEIELNFVGESKAVKELNGTLVKVMDKIPVRCLPKDLIQELDVDISSLNTFDDVIRVADLSFPPGIEVLVDSEETVASVSPPEKEEEEKVGEEKLEEEKVSKEEEQKEEKESKEEKEGKDEKKE